VWLKVKWLMWQLWWWTSDTEHGVGTDWRLWFTEKMSGPVYCHMYNAMLVTHMQQFILNMRQETDMEHNELKIVIRSFIHFITLSINIHASNATCFSMDVPSSGRLVQQIPSKCVIKLFFLLKLCV
jgi:hypothetical protein